MLHFYKVLGKSAQKVKMPFSSALLPGNQEMQPAVLPFAILLFQKAKAQNQKQKMKFAAVLPFSIFFLQNCQLYFLRFCLFKKKQNRKRYIFILCIC